MERPILSVSIGGQASETTGMSSADGSTSNSDAELDEKIKQQEEELKRLKALKRKKKMVGAQVKSSTETQRVTQTQTTSSDHAVPKSAVTESDVAGGMLAKPDVEAPVAALPATDLSIPDHNNLSWPELAFGSCTTGEWRDRLNKIDDMFKQKTGRPQLELKYRPLEEKMIISIIGNVNLGTNDQLEKKHRSTIRFEIIPRNTTEVSVQVVIVESGVKKNIFRKLGTVLKPNALVLARGVVQRDKDNKLFLCINDELDHVVLIEVETPIPEVYCMNGTPITFPVVENSQQLLGPFSDAWFCSSWDNDEVLEEQLRHHIVAYRKSGGVIYLGLKVRNIKPSYFEVENTCIGLSVNELEKLKKLIEGVAQTQSPPLLAQEWNPNDSKSLPNNIKQRYDECFNSYFCTIDRTRYIVRIVICPSKHPLHLCKESDIKLHIRHGGGSSSFYPVNEFVLKMSATSAEVLQEIKTISITSPNTAINIEDSNSVKLWEELDSESGSIENKERGEGDLVDYIIAKLRKYGATWLNGTMKGTLRIGVRNQPPLVTGVWLDKEGEELFRSKLFRKFQGSLDPDNFCFPSAALSCFSFKKKHIVANSNELWSKGSNLFVVWLKMPPHPSEKDPKLRHALAKKIHSYKLIVLPLNKQKISGLSPPEEGSFAFGLSVPPTLKMSDELDMDKILQDLKELIAGHQMVSMPTMCKDVLDPNYCVLEVTVRPRGSNLLSLCSLPKFWQLNALTNNEEGHVGKSPIQMSFQDIVLRCEGGNLAKDYLQRFFDSNDRPILITDVGNFDISQIKGLASIPWTMVIDFDYSSVDSKTLKEFAQDNPQSFYEICDLPLNKDFPVNPADMSSKALYWVKALGPPNDPMKDPQEWRIRLLPELSKYIKQIASITTNVKILVVWSAQEASSTFGVVVADLCLAAQQAAHPWRKTEIVVVSPAIVSTFLDDFRSAKISNANTFSMKLDSLSEFLLQFGFSDKGFVPQWLTVPTETVKSMKAGKLDYLFPGIEKTLDMHNYDHGLAFFEGREIVRWEDFKANNVIERQETKSLKDSIDKLLHQRRNTAVVKNFYHHPGAGGSTIARHVMWLLKSSHCCVIPSGVYPNLRDDIMTLMSATESAAALVLWDANLGIDFDTLKSKLDDLHVVILRVQRVEKRSHGDAATTKIGDLILEDGLSLTMLEAFVSLFRRNINLSKKSNALTWLNDYAKRTKDIVPLFHVMVTALENKFIPLPEYVKNRLINITEAQQLVLLRIAFARLFTSHPLQVYAVSDDADWVKWLSSSVSGLIAFDGQKQQNYRVRMRHHLIDEQILLQLGGTMQKPGPWQAEFVVDFICHLYKVYQNQIIDTSGNNEFENILRRLFHDKSDTESMQFPKFLHVIFNSGGKDVIIKCIAQVIEKLTPNKRICAHLLADLARVHLHFNFVDTDTNLKPAMEKMGDAHALLPNDRTLYHQEGQLCLDAIPLTRSHSLSVKPPLECATEIIKLAKQASDCFKISRDCEMQGRTNWQYPWISDVKCYIECFESVYKILNCSFSTLPRSLAKDSYIVNAMEEVSLLLNQLSTEDSIFSEKSRLCTLKLLGTKQEHERHLTKLFREIDGHSLKDEPKPTYPGYASTFDNLAKTLLQTSKLLRLMYQTAYLVPPNLSTRLTLATMWLIRQDRYVGTKFACMGHQERFFELQLIWEWSRYSKHPPLRKGLIDIIDKFLPNTAPDSLLRAKCLLFKCVTRLQQLLCDDEFSVSQTSIRALIAECTICSKKNNLHEREFFINGHGKGLLSLKDWPNRFYSTLDEEVNKYSSDLDLKLFSGCVQDSKGSVNCKGLSFFFEWHTAPPNLWKVNEKVKFFVSFSSHKGLRAHPVFPEEYLKQRPVIHRWDLTSRQQGRIVNIDEESGLLYLEPLAQSYEELARGSIVDIKDTGGVIPPPSIGDLYEFNVSRIKNKTESNYSAFNLQFIATSVEDQAY